MSTKYKILEAALDLFNKEGVDKVPLRKIAGELKISDGNLRYHFKHKELIIIQLFEQMQEELNQNREAKRHNAHTLSEILDSMKRSFEIQYKYRFILIGLVDICRKIEVIHHHYQQSKALWKNYFLENVNKMLENGYIAVEHDQEQKMNYFAICNMISNFWALDADLFGEDTTENVVDHYFKINCSLVKPYLTPKGKEEFLAYFMAVEN